MRVKVAFALYSWYQLKKIKRNSQEQIIIHQRYREQELNKLKQTRNTSLICEKIIFREKCQVTTQNTLIVKIMGISHSFNNVDLDTEELNQNSSVFRPAYSLMSERVHHCSLTSSTL